MSTVVLDAARAAYAAGLCLLRTRDDGSKAPDVPSWTDCKTTRPTVKQMRDANFAARSGLGMIAGTVSGYRECWDFDTDDVFHAFLDAARACGLADVVAGIRAGYEDHTPGGGRRWIVQYPESVTWQDCTLARRPGRDGEPPIKTLIELPTFAILAPSNGKTHPSGKAYVRVSGGFDTIARYTVQERDALMALARSFDELPRPQVRTPAPLPTYGTDPSHRPGDDYNRQMSWPAILEPAGWRLVYARGGVTYWCRPGKAHGISASTNLGGADLFYPFTSSTAFEPEKSYSKFAAYAVLEHGGDFSTAARALALQGYGQQHASPVPAGVSSSQVGDDDLTLTSLTTLLSEPDDAIEWEIDGLVAAGSVNLLAGKPKAGKSTLARQMAFCMATGTPFLGRACVGGPIWYLVLEDKRSEVRRHFRALGATGSEPVRFLFGNTKDLLGKLTRLAARERPRAIIVDTLQRLINAKDLNDYAEVTTRLEPVLAIARNTGAAVILVHHAAKADRAGIDSVLGSTALTGSVDNVFLLNRTERYRVLSSVQRIGTDLEETVITLDERGCLSGGQNRHAADVGHVRRSLLDALETNPNLTRAEWLDAVDGRKQVKLEALRLITACGTTICSGTGKKGDPFRYRNSDCGSQVPYSSREPEFSSPSLLAFPNSSLEKGGSQVPADLNGGSRADGTASGFDPGRLGRVLRGEEIP